VHSHPFEERHNIDLTLNVLSGEDIPLMVPSTAAKGATTAEKVSDHVAVAQRDLHRPHLRPFGPRKSHLRSTTITNNWLSVSSFSFIIFALVAHFIFQVLGQGAVLIKMGDDSRPHASEPKLTDEGEQDDVHSSNQYSTVSDPG